MDERPSLGLMFCCHLREILHHFWKRGIYFHFALGLPIIELVLSGQDSVISSLLLISSWRISLQYCPLRIWQTFSSGMRRLGTPRLGLGWGKGGGQGTKLKEVLPRRCNISTWGWLPLKFCPSFSSPWSPCSLPLCYTILSCFLCLWKQLCASVVAEFSSARSDGTQKPYPVDFFWGFSGSVICSVFVEGERYFLFLCKTGHGWLHMLSCVDVIQYKAELSILWNIFTGRVKE